MAESNKDNLATDWGKWAGVCTDKTDEGKWKQVNGRVR